MSDFETTKQVLQNAHIGCLVLGFPKSGTTSFAQWLDTSQKIDVSTPKETFQLCPEFAPNLDRSANSPLADSFSGAPEAVRVEATTLNVYSDSLRKAVSELPHIKAILLTRDPIETAFSWHNQMLQAGEQHAASFQSSWEFAVEQGDSLESDFLKRYDQVCSHGKWTKAWLDALGHQRLMVLRDQELRENAENLRCKLNSFFGREMGIMGDVPTRNVFSKVRFPLLYRTVRTPAFKSVIAQVERRIPSFGRVRRHLRDNVFLKPTAKRVDPAAEGLRRFFAQDEALLSSILVDNRSTWSVSA